MKKYFLVGASILLYCESVFACPAGKTCPSGQVCTDESQCVDDTTSGGVSSSNPSTTQDQLGLTYDPPTSLTLFDDPIDIDGEGLLRRWLESKKAMVKDTGRRQEGEIPDAEKKVEDAKKDLEEAKKNEKKMAEKLVKVEGERVKNGDKYEKFMNGDAEALSNYAKIATALEGKYPEGHPAVNEAYKDVEMAGQRFKATATEAHEQEEQDYKKVGKARERTREAERQREEAEKNLRDTEQNLRDVQSLQRTLERIFGTDSQSAPTPGPASAGASGPPSGGSNRPLWPRPPSSVRP